jgi:hypothetical protein
VVCLVLCDKEGFMSNNLIPLREYATRALITKNYSFSPLTVHFIQSSAKRFGVSESEFVRRIVDSALMEWVAKGLYHVPDEFRDVDPLPIPRPSPCRIAALKHKPSLYTSSPEVPEKTQE